MLTKLTRWFKGIIPHRKNRKLREAKRAGSAVGVIEALLDEYHEMGIRHIQMANEMQAFGQSKLDAVSLVVSLLDQYKVGDKVNVDDHLPQILRDLQEKYTALEKSDITQAELMSQTLIQNIINNTKHLP